MNGTRSRSRGRLGARVVARAAATLVAALGLLLQAFAVQSHAHAFSAPVVAAAEAHAVAHADDLGAPHHKNGCVLCQALAHSGHALSPSTAQVVEYASVAYEVAALAIRLAPRSLTHTWRSRAPPISL
jgi:hypothetical protein